jgi:hypothetical protein
MGTKILTPIGRVSWSYVFGEGDPEKAAKRGKPVWSMTLMLPKNADAVKSLGLAPAKVKVLLKEVEDFRNQVMAEGKELCTAQFKKLAGVRWNPILDGDEKAGDEDESGGWEGNKNFWLIRLNSTFKVQVRAARASDGLIEDGNTDPTSGFYSGCWARCYVSFSKPYNVDGNKGISLYLGTIQKAYNDSPFGQDADNFDDLEEDEENELF